MAIVGKSVEEFKIIDIFFIGHETENSKSCFRKAGLYATLLFWYHTIYREKEDTLKKDLVKLFLWEGSPVLDMNIFFIGIRKIRPGSFALFCGYYL